MHLKLFAVCECLKTLITSPREVICWIKSWRRSRLLFVSISSSSIRGRSSVLPEDSVVVIRFDWLRLSPSQRWAAPLCWRMICEVSSDRWFEWLVFISPCTWPLLCNEISWWVYTFSYLYKKIKNSLSVGSEKKATDQLEKWKKLIQICDKLVYNIRYFIAGKLTKEEKRIISKS